MSNAFSTSIELTIWVFLCSINVVYCIGWFCYVESPLHLCDKFIWSWYIILFNMLLDLVCLYFVEDLLRTIFPFKVCLYHFIQYCYISCFTVLRVGNCQWTFPLRISHMVILDSILDILLRDSRLLKSPHACFCFTRQFNIWS